MKAFLPAPAQKSSPEIRVGDWAVIGAGAVVIRDVKKAKKVAGVPAGAI